MATKLKLGTNNNWATKVDKLLAYNDENGNFKPIEFDADRSSTATRVNKEGLVENVEANRPRVQFSGNNGYLLLEPTRTNYATYSSDASQWGNVSGSQSITKTQNYSTAPDGTQTATRLQATATGSNYSLISLSTTSITGNYTGSVYLKSNTGNTENVVVYGRNTSVSSYAIGNQWQRIEFQGSGTSGQNLYLFLGSFPNNGSDESIDVLVWGGQLEAGTFSTSLIPTTTAVVTRTVDSCEIASGLENIIGQTEGTLFIDFEYLYETTTDSSTDVNRDILVLGTASDISEGVSIDNYRSQFRVFVQGSGMTTQSIGNNSTGASQPNTRYKLAVKYKTGDCKAYLNGSLLGSSTGTVSFATNLDGIFFSYNSSSRPYKNQKKVYQLQVFNTALSDAELIALTS